MEKTILSILKKTETAAKTQQRRKENPVYQDSYGHRTATLLAHLDKKHTEVQAKPATRKEKK